MLLYCYYLA